MAEFAEWFDTLDALPCEAEALFAASPFQSGRDWWRCVGEAAMPAGATARFLLYRESGRAVALLAVRAGPGATLASLSTPYTTLWQPLVAAGIGPDAVRRAGAAFGRACRATPVMRWDALDAGWPLLEPLLDGLRESRYVASRFDHFVNWHEPTTGLRWGSYLAARPGSLRETIRRKQARAARDATVRFQRAATPSEVAEASPYYREVYRQSWKTPEPYPLFDDSLLLAAAGQGALRLGLLFQGRVAVAAQYWIVSGGVASVLKLAHIEAARALSPGTLLTAWMIRDLLDRERVDELDFGRGDDPYKGLWTTRRRQRIGVVLADPWRAAGAATIARQYLGRAVRRLRRAPAQDI